MRVSQTRSHGHEHGHGGMGINIGSWIWAWEHGIMDMVMGAWMRDEGEG